MISVISATNRPQNISKIIASGYHNVLVNKGVESKLFGYDELPDFNPTEIFGKGEEVFSQFVNDILIPSEKLVMVIPEYNGSFPGITKLVLDSISPKLYQGKKIALVGVSAGRAGNLRGLDQFATVLNYVGAEVQGFKHAIAHVDQVVADGAIVQEKTLKFVEKHVDSFLLF